MAYLEFHTPEGSRRYEIAQEPITIGRHPDNMVIIRDERSSRFHCVVEPSEAGFDLRDLKSRNGTKLNGEKVKRQPLRNGDTIAIGSTEITFIDPNAPAKEEEAGLDPIAVEGLDAELEPSGGIKRRNIGLDDIDDPLASIKRGKRKHASLPSYAQQIMAALDAVPTTEPVVEDIALVDAQGVTRHAAGKHTSKSKRSEAGSEAIYALKLLLLSCLRTRATDLHIEPKRTSVNVRIRVDGFLVRLSEIPNSIGNRISMAVKVLCQIDTSQHRIVQEGHFSVVLPDRHVDYRVSFTPSVEGQNLVIRVLDSAAAPTALHRLGMPGYMHDCVRKICRQDSGLLMVCGPTGSGKTTTLYAVLREIDREQRNVITIEDPVELQIDGVTQLPVNEDRGNTFAGLLRSVLRQDPDVLLVGEIRDVATAKTAMQASMTGHVVLTTVHARDTIGSIFRLIDLGVEPYLVANALNMVLAQRLVRTLCETCSKPIKPTPPQNMAMGRYLEGVSEIRVPVGCNRCLHTGFLGRQAVFELLQFTDELRDVILNSPTIQAMRRVIAAGLFTTLQQSSYQLVAKGATSFSEAERVAGTVDG